MAVKPGAKGKGKGKGKGKNPAGRTRLLIGAVTAFWAAANEPADLNTGSAIVWALTAVSVWFVVSAVLTLLGPAALLLIRLWPPPPAPSAREPDET